MEDNGYDVVIADFGLSSHTWLEGKGASTAAAMTTSISPPEVLRDVNAPRGKAVDVYAFGIVMLEVLTGRCAYSPGLRRTDIQSIVCAGQRPCIPDDVLLA